MSSTDTWFAFSGWHKESMNSKQAKQGYIYKEKD